MATTEEILRDNLQYLVPVPAYQPNYVCVECLGPVDGYYRCPSCRRLFEQGLPDVLQGTTVPMTIAANPSAWYTQLVTYKKFQFREYAPVLVSLSYHFLRAHAYHVQTILGGPPDCITTVPSRAGTAFAANPLNRALRLVAELRDQLQDVVRFRTGASLSRREYNPDAFECVDDDARGKRIILIEDLWVSGATSISAAGALLHAGARNVIVIPIAREIRKDSGFFRANLEYFEWCNVPYDIANWPR